MGALWMGGPQDGRDFGAWDVVVGGCVGDRCFVDPTFGSGGVEGEASGSEGLPDGPQGFGKVEVVGKDRDVIHVGSDRGGDAVGVEVCVGGVKGAGVG